MARFPLMSRKTEKVDHSDLAVELDTLIIIKLYDQTFNERYGFTYVTHSQGDIVTNLKSFESKYNAHRIHARPLLNNIK